MSWFEDLGRRTQTHSGCHVCAVGWLSANQPFTKGEVHSEFLVRLKEFRDGARQSEAALGWSTFMGIHVCELCWPGKQHEAPLKTASGLHNFGVPSRELLFVAPELVYHYVETHGYRPPDAFISAVRQAPLPGSEEYQTLVKPFRRLHVLDLAQQFPHAFEKALGRAAGWAHDRGGGDAAIREAALKFLEDDSMEICERIRQTDPLGKTQRNQL